MTTARVTFGFCEIQICCRLISFDQRAELLPELLSRKDLYDDIPVGFDTSNSLVCFNHRCYCINDAR